MTRHTYDIRETRCASSVQRKPPFSRRAYTVVSEMVVTEQVAGDSVRRIRGRDTFGPRDYLYDQAGYFDDPDFWGNYNIIEPTESLEHAIDKLKKNR